MPALALAVKFRALAEELDDAEFRMFVSQLYRNLLLDSLFNQFRNENNQQVHAAISHINRIICSRDTQSECATPIALHLLPGALIGELGSYLTQNSYINFSKCCRSVYVACNTPNTLRSLHISGLNDYSAINLQKYPQLTHLHLDLDNFQDLRFPSTGTVCNRLTHLHLNFSCADDEVAAIAAAEEFDKCTSINLSGVTHLNLSHFGCAMKEGHVDYDGDYWAITLLRLLSKFNGTIQALRLSTWKWHIVEWNEEQVREALHHALPRLATLDFGAISTGFAAQITGLFSEQLLALSIPTAFALPPNAQFGKLNELVGVRSETMRTISRSNKNVRRICCLKKTIISQELINTLLLEQTGVEELMFDVQMENMDNVCNYLDRALFKVSATRSLQIKISVICDKTEASAEKIFFNMSRVANRLTFFGQDFAIMCRAYGPHKPASKEWMRCVQSFRPKNERLFDIFTDIKKRRICLVNRRCNKAWADGPWSFTEWDTDW